MLRHFSFALLAFSVCVPLPAQDLEDEFPPGLLARYSVGDATCERIDDSISFVWNDESPDPRLPSGKFSANWKAFQLVRKNAKYTFHVYLSGSAELKIDGETVLSGESATPRWFSGQEIELSFGEVEFELEYKKLSDSAVLKLYLSSDYFPLEPVSEGLFFREEKHPEWSALERGRQQFVAARCANCHATKLGLPMMKAPALDRINGSLSSEWIVRKLTDPAAAAPHGQMPRFDFSKEDARIVADYLIGGA
ncbi:MAG TPA: PA14 domain-containing protein, partial [Planctomycetaceae bacterium]|nr:PA14 domain-containing protein [Planctomycetaceae bacterium]